MRVLFIGGTGLISSAASPLVVERGHDLTLVTRGTSAKAAVPAGAAAIVTEVHDTEAFRAAIKADLGVRICHPTPALHRARRLHATTQPVLAIQQG